MAAVTAPGVRKLELQRLVDETGLAIAVSDRTPDCRNDHEGLKVHAGIDDRNYPAGVKVPDSEMAEIKLRREDFHGEWNYEILPRK